MCSHLFVLRGDNVIAVNLENSVRGEGLRECHTIDCYLLIAHVYQALIWKFSEPVPYLDDIRIGNYQAISGCGINIP